MVINICEKKYNELIVSQSLMTGLMYYRPDDHVDYLLTCLEKVKDENICTINWNLFIDQRRKSPLPPITPLPNGENGGENGRTAPLSRESSFVTRKLTNITVITSTYNSGFVYPGKYWNFIIRITGPLNIPECHHGSWNII